MARPSKTDITSGLQNWDGHVNDNFDVILSGPMPMAEHSGDESDLASTYPAASYDRCMIWVNHTVDGWKLYVSDGSSWIQTSLI